MKKINFLILLAFTLMMAFGSAVFAASIEHLRAYSNADKTRVVLDLDFKPVYSTAQNNDEFIIRVKSVSNARNAPARLQLEKRSVVSRVGK